MNHPQPESNATTLSWPITQQGKRIAQQFAQHHSHRATAERVRRNTLAVWVMHDFLDTLGISTNLAASDSWNPAIQLTEDVADLVIPGVGRLECRPMLSRTGSSTVVPSEVLAEERIGYVAITLDEGVGEASLLGFVADISTAKPQLRLDRLRSMEDFPHHLQRIRQRKTAPVLPQLVRLSQWLEGHFDNGWQATEDLLAHYLLMPAFRQIVQPPQQQLPIKRAKQFDIGLTLDNEQIIQEKIALVLEVEQTEAEVVDIAMRLYPLGESLYLPEGLRVRVIDEKNTVCLTAQARNVDDYLRLYFRGFPEEPFKIQITRGEVCIEENFII